MPDPQKNCPFQQEVVHCGPDCALYGPTVISPNHKNDLLTFSSNKCALMVIAENAYFDLLAKTEKARVTTMYAGKPLKGEEEDES